MNILIFNFIVFIQRLAQVHVRILAPGYCLLDVHSGARLYVSVSQNSRLL